MRFSSIDCYEIDTPKYIKLICDWTKVIWITAAAHIANVVYLQSDWYWTFVFFVEKSM